MPLNVHLQAELGDLELLYHMDIELGTPPQSLSLAIDTVGDLMWVPSAQTQFYHLERTYDPELSSTHMHMADVNRTIEYSSEIQGLLSMDRFTMHGVTLENCEFAELINFTGFKLEEDDSDSGRMGLIYRRDAYLDPAETNAGLSILEEMVHQKKILRPLFAISLPHMEMSWGTAQDRLFKGAIQWVNVPVDYQGTWMMGGDALEGKIAKIEALDGTETPLFGSHFHIDSVNAFSIIPGNALRQICQGLNGCIMQDMGLGFYGAFVLDGCKSFSHEPRILFDFDNGVRLELKTHDWLHHLDAAQLFESGQMSVTEAREAAEREPCLLRFFGDDTWNDIGFWSLGMPILHSYYAIFDAETAAGRIGFAEHVLPEPINIPSVGGLAKEESISVGAIGLILTVIVLLIGALVWEIRQRQNAEVAVRRLLNSSQQPNDDRSESRIVSVSVADHEENSVLQLEGIGSAVEVEEPGADDDYFDS